MRLYCPVDDELHQACMGTSVDRFPPIALDWSNPQEQTMVREFEVTTQNRRGETVVTTMLLSDDDAAALGDAARLIEDAPTPAKARQSPNKARSTKAKGAAR